MNRGRGDFGCRGKLWDVGTFLDVICVDVICGLDGFVRVGGNLDVGGICWLYSRL